MNFLDKSKMIWSRNIEEIFDNMIRFLQSIHGLAMNKKFW